MYGKDVGVGVLIGQTITSIEPQEDSNGGFIFKTKEGKTYWMGHHQSCCEDVDLEDWEGDWEILIGNPILVAEENSNSDQGSRDQHDESYTWTFYKFATIKGHFDLRWYGTSNGYYSEDVSFVDVTPKEN